MTSSLARRPEIFCWVFSGRTPRSLMLFVGQMLVSVGEPEHVAAAVAAEFEQLAAGPLLRAVLRAGDAGHAGQAGEDGVPELVLQRFAHVGGDGGQALLAGGVPGMDQAAQRPLRLHGPDRARVGLGAVLVVAQEVSQARLVPGDVLPPGMEVVLVAVGDHDPGEAREDPGVRHGVQAAGAQPERGVLLGERAVDVLLLPGRPGPQRGLVEPGHRSGGDQGADQPHHVRGQGRRLSPGRNGRTRPRRRRRSRRRSAAGTAPPGHAGRRPGKRPGHAAAARSTAAESGTPAGRAAACTRPQAHLASCRSCCTRSAGAAGISSC